MPCAAEVHAVSVLADLPGVNFFNEAGSTFSRQPYVLAAAGASGSIVGSGTIDWS